MSGALTRMLGRTSGVAPGKSFSFDGVDDYIELASAVVTDYPCTICAWFNSAGTANTQAHSVASIGGTTSRLALVDASTGADVIAAQGVTTGATSREGLAASGYTNGTWFHGAGVHTNANSRTGYQNGVAGTPNTQAVAVSGFTKTTIGAYYQSGGRTKFLNGKIAHVAIWNIALSGSDIASLATPGTLPSSIQAANLVFYAALTGGLAVDSVSATSLTVSGALSSTDGPF